MASVTTNWVETPRGLTNAVARIRSRPREIPAAFQEMMKSLFTMRPLIIVLMQRLNISKLAY